MQPQFLWDLAIPRCRKRSPSGTIDVVQYGRFFRRRLRRAGRSHPRNHCSAAQRRQDRCIVAARKKQGRVQGRSPLFDRGRRYAPDHDCGSNQSQITNVLKSDSPERDAQSVRASAPANRRSRNGACRFPGATIFRHIGLPSVAGSASEWRSVSDRNLRPCWN